MICVIAYITYTGSGQPVFAQLHRRMLKPEFLNGRLLVRVRDLRQARRLCSIPGVQQIHCVKLCRHPSAKQSEKSVIPDPDHLEGEESLTCPVCHARLEHYLIVPTREKSGQKMPSLGGLA